MRFRHWKTGAAIPMLQHIFTISEPGSDRAVGLGTIGRDITERKRADDQLRRAEANLAADQRLSNTGSWARNVVNGETFVSQQWLRIHGLDPQQPAPSFEDFLRIVHPDDQPRLEQVASRAERDRSGFEVHYRIALPGGALKHVDSRARAVLDERGELREFVGTTVDVTERKLADEALRKAQAEPAHVGRVLSLGALSASIAHEINQPLAAIVTNGSACLSWLEGAAPNLAEARAAAQRIVRDGSHAGAVIHRIRALLKKTDPQRLPLDINLLIREVMELTHGELSRYAVVLQTDLATTLPAVLGARVELQQVLLNLVINAIEAMTAVPDRPRRLLIKSRYQRAAGAGGVVVTVRDSGVGIAAGDFEQVLEAFHTTKPSGLGMGLTISRSIVESHGGRLWGRPNVRRGAIFEFALPAAPQ